MKASDVPPRARGFERRDLNDMEDQKKIIERSLKKAGSLEALFEKAARSRNLDDREPRISLIDQQNHPSEEALYNYVLGWLENEAAEAVMDHLGVCDHCAEEVLRIRAMEDELREHALRWADRQSWLNRLKLLISNLSFPVTIQTQVFEGARGPGDEDNVRVVKIGDPLVLSVRAPEAGHVVVFHYTEKDAAARLVYPDRPADVARIPANQEVTILEGEVDGPEGEQVFKIIWTRDQLIDPQLVDWDAPAAVDAAVEEFFQKLEALTVDQDWQETVCEYHVVRD